MAPPSGPLWLDVYHSPYSNGSNMAADVFFLAIISASLVCCLAVSWKTQRCIPFSFVMCLAYILEIVAYALRLQSWHIVRYTVDVGLSTVAPVLLTIGIHLCTAQVLTVLGTEHAVLSPNAHMRVFIWTDILAGILQAIGLGLTFTLAKQAGPWGVLLPSQAGAGQVILYAGLLLQTITLASALVLLAIAYAQAGKSIKKYGYTTFHRDGAGYVPLSPRFKTFLVVLPLAAVCVLVRCGYRVVAVWGGLGSPAATDEVLWLVAEGVMLTEAMVSLAAFHPAIWLDDGSNNNYDDEDVEDGQTKASFLGKGKRLSAGTTTTTTTTTTEMKDRRIRDSRQNLEEVSQLIFSSHLIAPSDASSEGSASRRGSAGEEGHPRPAYQNEPYDPHDTETRYSEDITTETRALSPMEAEEERDRLDIEPIPIPRKSSKRARVLSPPEEDSDDDRLEIESIVLPPRKPSKRETRREGDDDMEDVALTSTYSHSVYSQ